MESTYREMDNSEEDSTEKSDIDENNTEMTVSTDDTDDEEDEGSEE
jgi:hypothetical protein